MRGKERSGERWNDGAMWRAVDSRSGWHLAVLKPLQTWSSSLSDVENWDASLCANFLFLELRVVVFIICPGCGSPVLVCIFEGTEEKMYCVGCCHCSYWSEPQAKWNPHSPRQVAHIYRTPSAQHVRYLKKALDGFGFALGIF